MIERGRVRVRAFSGRGGPRGLTLAWLLLASTGAAEPFESGPFRLDWSGPGSCPNAASLVARIESLLGAPVADVLKSPLAARGRVREASAERFELSLETFQAEQRFTREMQAPTCAELGDAAALVLALAIDPALRERLAKTGEPVGPAPEPPLSSSTPPVASSAPPVPAKTAAPAEPESPAPRPAETADKTRAGRSRSPGFFGAAAVVADFGSVPPPAFGPALTFGAYLGAFELDLDASWLPPKSTVVAQPPDKGGDISLFSVTVRPCGVLAYRRLQGGLCGAFDLGDIWGTGFGTQTQATRHSPFVAAGGALFLRYRLTENLALGLRGTALFPLQDVEFTLENVDSVYRVPSLVGRLALAFEVHFD